MTIDLRDVTHTGVRPGAGGLVLPPSHGTRRPDVFL